MTTTAPEPATPRPRQPSNLMAIVLAYKNGEVDWPTTKDALVDFPYVAEESPPKIGAPGYAEWYGRADNFSPPNTIGELTEAAYGSDFEYDRFVEVAAALRAKFPRESETEPAQK